ncbi:MAG: Crp/Fnr family transcriptional regulator [Bacteroidales bacterium]|jgi:CRP-like cAMP-binding protein|nr:Crp/Fnr family transcriptional regulator [Bacteroidales bacterium]
MNFDKKCSNCTVGSCALYTLSKVEVLSMENQTHQTKFRKGEILRKQDSPLESIIYLRNGYVKEYMSHDSLSDQVIQLIKPRSYIGLQGLSTNTASVFSYQVITDVEVCFIEKSIFNSLIRGNGNFAREILVSLSKEYLSNQKRFLSLNQTQIFGKVAGLLIYLSEEVYENSNFDIHLTRTELAQMVASTRESVTRTLKWFQNEGIILMDKNMIKIHDWTRLSEIAKRG